MLTVSGAVRKSAARNEVFCGYYFVRMSLVRQYLQFEFDYAPSHSIAALFPPNNNNDVAKSNADDVENDTTQFNNDNSTTPNNDCNNNNNNNNNNINDNDNIEAGVSACSIDDININNNGISKPMREKEEKERMERTGLECDLDRLVDDFVFLCFMAGNDFVPGLPSIDIMKGVKNFVGSFSSNCVIYLRFKFLLISWLIFRKH
jgi:hypothetical protein